MGDPVRDLDIINEELRLKDIEYFEKVYDEVERKFVRGGDKTFKTEYEILSKIKKMLIEDKRHLRFGDWNQNDIEVLNKHLFITSKPMIYLVNLSEKDFIRKKNKFLPKIKEYVDKNDPGATIIPFSGAFEQNLMEMESEEERKKYQEETKCTTSLEKIFEKGFIMAEVMKFDEYKEHGSEAGVKAAGGYRQQGKNYTVADGDIIFFKFNAGAGLTAKKK